MTSSNRPSVFIEKIFPVTLLNQQVYYEHGGNPFKGLHRWYSRKPLSFSRASVLGSLLPDSVTPEEFEYLLGLERRLGGQPDTKTKLYKTPPSPERIKQVHDLCEKTWGTRTPTVLDAFAGGGSIPFEAVRYGLNVLASDLNPVAVVTMKAAMEYPLKFGPDLQHDIDKWVKWVGDEAEKRLTKFFPTQKEERIEYYLWTHTIDCPKCSSVVPLSPTWWLSRVSNYAGAGKARTITNDWYAAKPIIGAQKNQIEFEVIKGRKGSGTTIKTPNGDYDPSHFATVNRGVAKCLNCGSVLDNKYVCAASEHNGLGHQLYAVAHRLHEGDLEFVKVRTQDLSGLQKIKEYLEKKKNGWEAVGLIAHEAVPTNPQYSMIRNYGITEWFQCFNDRQLVSILTFVEVIKAAKETIFASYEPEKAQAILTYLIFVLDRLIDKNSRLTNYDSPYRKIARATATHALNLMWNYPELNGGRFGWLFCAKSVTKNYSKLCSLLNIKSNQEMFTHLPKDTSDLNRIDVASAGDLTHIPDKSIHAVVTDPPYYSTIPYADLSDFFYVWQRRLLDDVFPELYSSELTDKDREAVANPARFQNMGLSPKELANRD